MLALAASSILALTASRAQAADGDLLRTISAANPEACQTNIGIAFDGTDLLVSCVDNNVIDVVRTSDGSLVRTITATSESGLGALALDSTRGKVWACSPAFGNGIVLIDPATGASSNAITPTTGGCQDGLAYDGIDDTLYHSADIACTIGHTRTDGTPIASFDVCNPPLLGDFGNSGIAVGGDKLYMSNNGGSQIYRVEKDFSASTLFATLPTRLEDMECDNITFAPRTAIWVIDAYDRTLNAFEIPVGSCNFGGLPPGLTLTPAAAQNPVGTSHTVTATLSNPGGANAGQTVLFTVAGANPTSGTATTDAGGNATFNYTGANAGTDTITACYDRDASGACNTGEPTATASKAWVAVTEVSVGDVTVDEGNTGLAPPTAATFNVSLDTAATGPVTVRYATSEETATAPADYLATEGTLTFAPGETSKTVTVDVRGDLVGEPDETFHLRLSSPTNAEIDDADGLGKIIDDDRSGGFSCRAVGLRLLGAEVALSNGPNVPCKDDSRSLLNLPLGVGTGAAGAKLVNSSTNQTPDDPVNSSPAVGDRSEADAEAASTILVSGLSTVRASVVRSHAEARCESPLGGPPTLSGSSTLVSLAVNGQPVAVGNRAMTINLPLGVLHVNSKTTTATTITQRGIWFENKLLPSSFDIVVAEAKADFSGNPCT